MIFPGEGAPTGPRTRLAWRHDDQIVRLTWAGWSEADETVAAAVPGLPFGPGLPLLGEQSHGLLTRPHLRGHRADGGDWSTRFAWAPPRLDGLALTIDGVDDDAGLTARARFESLPGGALRGWCEVTNDGPGDYHVDGLEVVLPVPDRLTSAMDFTGRHEHERAPQRHEITDGLWLRESRGGRPGLGAASMLVAGSPGFDTDTGEVMAAHVAWSGNSVLRLERDPAAVGTTLGGGELLRPGEVVLAAGESYRTPWVVFACATDGLDGIAASLHEFERSLPAHPAEQPVILNVWEAVFFDHDFGRLTAIAERAARVGVERFVLDDGWFLGRREDTAGLGDWSVDPDVWPDGLSPLIDRVRDLGMRFGLWFEPEMVNPDSRLHREHPDWILGPRGRVPMLQRNQLVLDLTRPQVWQYLFEQVDDTLSRYAIDYVKWDHNRDLLEAGSAARHGAAAASAQTEAFYRLLDALRAAHPEVAWESCASGGGRIDLGVLERVQRVWTSDMTDALARQRLQRWACQLVAPEYLGAHVSAPTSHTTGRTLDLDFRAATAMFGAFGIEWDLSLASEDDLDRLGEWIDRYTRFRPLLHSGRIVRPSTPDPTVLLHGVVAQDASEALVAHVQLDEPSHNRGVFVRVGHLDPDRRYLVEWEGPVMERGVSASAPLAPVGPTAGEPLSGRALGEVGFWIPRRRPETATLVHLRAE